MIVVSPLVVPISVKKNFSINLNIFRNIHYQSLNKAKINYKQLIASQLSTVLPNKLSPPIKIDYYYYPGTKRLADLSNVMSIQHKFFEDALVELGYLEDDNYTIIPETANHFGAIDGNNPRVEIHIEENYGH